MKPGERIIVSIIIEEQQHQGWYLDAAANQCDWLFLSWDNNDVRISSKGINLVHQCMCLRMYYEPRIILSDWHQQKHWHQQQWGWQCEKERKKTIKDWLDGGMGVKRKYEAILVSLGNAKLLLRMIDSWEWVWWGRWKLGKGRC